MLGPCAILLRAATAHRTLEEPDLLQGAGALLGVLENWRSGLLMCDRRCLECLALTRAGRVRSCGYLHDPGLVRSARNFRPIVISGIDTLFYIGDKQFCQFLGVESLAQCPGA